MKTIKSTILFIFLIFCYFNSKSINKSEFPIIKGDYLGQIPSALPTVFSAGIISTGLYERDFTISPDGNEIYYSLFMGDWNTIMVTKRVNGLWQEPVVAEFARDTTCFFAEPALSIDGKKLFFLSTKARENEMPKPGWANQNIWFVEKQANGSWSTAIPLPQNINELDEFFPSLTKDGTLYFCRTDSKTKVSQILRSRFVNGVYQDPEVLPAPINDKGTIFNACIAPDDSYLIGCVSDRDDSNKNKPTYMLFFHNSDDSWSNGIDLIKELNLPCPFAISISVSFDGKYLFFASSTKTIKFKDLQPEWKFSSIEKRRLVAGNGNSDIYWMKIEDGFKKLKK